ncbi:MAG: RimK family alpha-L-glutamate ligase [Sphingomicrobium sp.]
MSMQIARPAVRPSLLFLVGADRDDQIRVQGSKVKVSGSSDIHLLVHPNQTYDLLQITPHMLRQRRRPDLTPYSCLVNLITEPERNERVLDNLRKLLRGVPGKVVNRPEAVLRSTRDQVARRLAGVTGLWVPKAIRLRTAKANIVGAAVEKAGMKFPLILRQVATHTGNFVGRFDTIEELQSAIEQDIDHIATEFVDFPSSDGLYRKYRVFFVGQELIFRHKIMSDQWNVHGKDRERVMAERPDLIEEERSLFATSDGAFSSEINQALKEIRRRIALDFFGIDFGIAPDGRVLLFEANATMSIYSQLPGPQFDYLQSFLPPARIAFRKLIGTET